MGVLHAGQLDGGRTIDLRAGMRKMQTLRKLPTSVPKTKTMIIRKLPSIIFRAA
jgi:hypothetical protein